MLFLVNVDNYVSAIITQENMAKHRVWIYESISSAQCNETIQSSHNNNWPSTIIYAINKSRHFIYSRTKWIPERGGNYRDVLCSTDGVSNWLRDERNRLRIKSHGGDLYGAPRCGSILTIHRCKSENRWSGALISAEKMKRRAGFVGEPETVQF